MGGLTLKEISDRINLYCKEHPEDLDKSLILADGREFFNVRIYKPYGMSNRWSILGCKRII